MREILDKLKRPFKAEIKAGCLNTAVFGGFDQYILNNLDQLKACLQNQSTSGDMIDAVSKLKSLFLDYKRVLPDDRLEIIRNAIPLIQALDKVVNDAQNVPVTGSFVQDRLEGESQPQSNVDEVKGAGKKPEMQSLQLGLAADVKEAGGHEANDAGNAAMSTGNKVEHKTRKSGAQNIAKMDGENPLLKNSLSESKHKGKEEGTPKQKEQERSSVKELLSTVQGNATIENQLQTLGQLETLARSVQYIKGIGPKRAQIMKRLNVENILDLFYYLPREYSDRSEILPIAEIKDVEGEVTVTGRVVSVQETRPNRGMKIVKVGIHDGTGLAFGVWFNQPYIKDLFKVNDEVVFSGKINQKNFARYRKLEFSNPVYENLEAGENVHTRRIVPIYPLTDGITQKNVREMVKNAIDGYLKEMPDLIPPEYREKHRLLPIDETLLFIHFPENRALLEEAKRRLIYEDFFLLQLGILYQRQLAKSDQTGYQCEVDGELLTNFFQQLPFALTGAQKRVWQEIAFDMQKNIPMHRLLQGDVGSGKTVVAALTILKGIENGLQGALMAPTEILAEQHYLSLRKWFEALGLNVALLTGSLKKKERDIILEQLQKGEINLVIGTHALIQLDVEFAKLGVVVIDEQHRFGVEQRNQLQTKGIHPHVLVMTATPIPRSMALTIYGDLDLSIIDELPPGRKPINTVWRGPETREKIYAFIKEQLNAGHQAYVVCPLIDESDVIDVESATQMAEYLAGEVFSEYRVELLTGQTPGDERDRIMRDFRDGTLDILVATTVIEVGVDVPNANIMLIEDAQRFGLAQLHQLRGRVGRGHAQSYCILVGEPTTEEGERRLQVMVDTTDGFKIAEEDLAIRGPGEFFGTRQHGLPEFKVANLIRDWEVLELVRKEVQELLASSADFVRPELLKIILGMRFKGSFLTEE